MRTLTSLPSLILDGPDRPALDDAALVDPHAAALERNKLLHQIADKVGIRLPNTIVKEGEALIDSGQRKVRGYREKVAALPLLPDAIETVRGLETAEAAQDFAVPLSAIRADPIDCGLFNPQKKDKGRPLGYTRTGWNQVIDFVRPEGVRGAASVLLAVKPANRSRVFNEWAEQSTRSESVILRTHRPVVGDVPQRRTIRAVVSERFVGVDDSLLLAAAHDAAKEISPSAKVRVTREEHRTDIEVIFPMMAREIRVGDALWGYMRVTNSHDKHASVKVTAGVFRVLCYNCTTAYSKDEDAISLRHMGELKSLLRKTSNALFVKARQIEPFVKAFGDAYDLQFPSFLQTRGEVLTSLDKAFDLPTGVVELAKDAWDADGTMSAGDTLGGLVNALTRASQGLDFDAADEVENVAGLLVMRGWNGFESAALRH